MREQGLYRRGVARLELEAFARDLSICRIELVTLARRLGSQVLVVFTLNQKKTFTSPTIA